MSAIPAMPNQEPSPEVKDIIKEWCRLNEVKYGPEWKKILAKEMAEKTMKELGPLLSKLV